ncbi:MAG: hypothetical protein EA378_08990 [Phycisphaerales bacterium]|nr:MAG: hypothetical protein EA378_08990 [Phycisphaerales bacterium]
MTTPSGPGGAVGGHVLVLFAFDVGFQVDLDAAGRAVQESRRLEVVRARRPAPVWFDYSPAPLRFQSQGPSVSVGESRAEEAVDVLLYDFGAVLLTYRLPLPATIGELPALSARLSADRGLVADARTRVERIMAAIGPAIERPRLHEAVEDYVIFAVTDWPEGQTPESLAVAHASTLTSAIEGETIELAPEQQDRLMQSRIAYAPTDVAVIDWNAAVLFDREPEDVVAVLQHANVELLELRVLDDELDAILDHADETLNAIIGRRIWPALGSGRLLARFAGVQTDAAVMFEGVNNAIKLVGNQYLARLYRLAAQRLDLQAWQTSVQRKLEAADNLYDKMSDTTSVRRLETLEWVIIILIAISILLMIFPVY